MTISPLALPAVPAVDLNLRPYQLTAVDGARRAWTDGVNKLLVVIPTGGGKTHVFSAIVMGIAANGRRALVLAHRTELLEQGYLKLVLPPEAGGLGLPRGLVGMIRSGDSRSNPNAPIQIGSVSTLASRIRRKRRAGVQEGATAREYGLPDFDLIVIDEAHRTLAESYQLVSSLYPNVMVLGVTATPYRMDGRGLGEFYDDLISAVDVETLIAGGWLVRTRVFTHPVKADVSNVKVNRNGDYDEAELQAIVDNDVLVGNIVDHWRSLAGGARTFCYAAGIQHSQHLAARFVAQGIPAMHVDGTTDERTRARALADFRAGRLLVLCNYDLFTEGTDVPECKCIILARHTRSEVVYRQQVGRGMRPFPGVPDIDAAVVLDHAGCALRFGLPEDPPKPSLRGKERRGAGEMPVKECPGCYGVIPAVASECPNCGWLFGEEREPGAKAREQDGQLVELKENRKKKEKALRSNIQAAMLGSDDARGWKPGTTNAACLTEFGKSRKDMDVDELREVLAWITSPAFERQYPLPKR